MKMNHKTGLFHTQTLKICNPAGALLLSALMLSSLSASAQTGFIPGDSANGYNLNDLFSPPTNNVVNNSIVDNSNSGTDGIVGSAHPWHLENDFDIFGADNGVHFTSGGSVTNFDQISGGNNGVLISGSAAANVFNGFEESIIGTTNNGVELDNGGSVINREIASITGGTNGVLIKGGTGFVQNNEAGSITGQNGNGVELDAAGVVDNESGNIQGLVNGVYITGGTGYVTNINGVIQGGTHEGVELDAGGTVFNQGLANIDGANNGVDIRNDVGFVINDAIGEIWGTNFDGVAMAFGGVVIQTNGSIGGNLNGIQSFSSSSGPLYVENHGGTITGVLHDGIHAGYNGAVFNTNGGAITGGRYGVVIDGIGAVTNINSTITGNGRSGVRIRGGGTVINSGTEALIYGNHDGVHISGGFGDVENYDGQITGNGDNGVQLDQGGHVENSFGFSSSGGQINGFHDGVSITNGFGSVENDGTIIGTNHAGVHMTGSGTVNNSASGTIHGGEYGVEISGVAPIIVVETPPVGANASVYNYGTITGGTRSGIRMRNGGYVLNDGNFNESGPGNIFGGTDGIQISGGAGQVDNYNGTITGFGHSGVHLLDSGKVYNYIGGQITGHDYGIEIAGVAPLPLGGLSTPTNAYVFNDFNGNIAGTNRAGIRFRNGGNIDNYGNVYGGTEGIHIDGGVANVYNRGTVTGNNGTAILFGSDNDSLTLDTGSHLNGIADAGDGNDQLTLKGDGSEGNNFVNFESLTVNADHWTLTGSNVFSDSVFVNSGLLSIGTNGVGTLVTPLVTVTPDGGLGGAGTIIGTVDNQGDLMPGNSIGTLTIIGDYTNGGNYHVQVNGNGTSDNVNISGQATINSGELIVEPEHGLFGPTTTFSIMTASNGIANEFTGTELDRLFLTVSDVEYIGDTGPLPTNIQVTIDRIPFKSVARTYNERAVAGALDKIIDPVIAGVDPGMSNVVDSEFAIDNAGFANQTFDSMSGEIHGTAGMLDGQQQDMFNHSIALRTGRLSTGDAEGGYANTKPVYLATTGSSLPPAQMEADKPWDIWFQGVGNFGDLNGDGNASGGSFTMSGFAGGLDYRVNQELLIGLAIGYTHDDINAGVDSSSAKVDAIQFGGYASYISGPWHFDGIISYGSLSTSTKRFAAADETLLVMPKASYDGGIISLSAEGGYDFKLCQHVTFQPSLGVIYNHLDQDSFKEKNGGPLGLDVKSVTMDSFRSDVSLKLLGNWGKEDGVRFQPQVRAGWQHEFADRTASVDESFLGDSTGTKFNVRGVQLGTETFTLGAGVTVPFNKTISAFLNYDASLNDQLTSQTVSGGLSIGW